jgi:hypothetical protein
MFPSGANPHPLARTRRAPFDPPGSPFNRSTRCVSCQLRLVFQDLCRVHD